MSPINAKEKGKRGEREWTKVLLEAGYDARRTGFHQSQQGHDAPDVTCKEIPIHWEVKNTEKCLILPWMAQSIGDAKDHEIPCVVWKKNQGRWIAILPAKDLMKMIQCCDLKALEELIQMK